LRSNPSNLTDRRSFPRAPLLSAAVELRRLERNQRRSEDELRAEQLARLNSVLAHAGRNVPLYRHLHPTEVSEGISSMETLKSLPVVGREDVARCEISDRLSGPVPAGSRMLWSSGTTGNPLWVGYAPEAAWWQAVLALRAGRARGIQPWHRIASLTIISDDRPRPPTIRLARRRQTALPSSLEPAEIVHRLLAARPSAIGGHGHLLVEAGEALGGRLRPRVVSTHGEQLSPENRTAITNLFGVAPLDTYGTTEVGVVAWQCSAGDLYHINNEAVIVEVLDDQGSPVEPGETGDLVLTGLWNPLMPFIRYRIGDRGALATRSCKCGVALPALASIDGRAMDWLTDAGGRRIAPQRLFVTMLVGEEVLSWIRRYRVVQERTGRVRVEIAPREDPPETHIDRIRETYQSAFGPGIPVEVKLVDRLDLDNTGKFRMFLSEGSESRVG
jgi:phenylacetate-CoA ligase